MLYFFNKEMLAVAKQHKSLSGLMLFYIASVFIGAWRYYSPIPAGDMWDGYINFYLQLLDGNFSAWWAQHNEHRLFLSRLFFYLDLKFFNGLSLILIPLNLLLLVTSWGLLLYFSFRLLKPKIETPDFFYFIVLLTVFAFSWKQDENIVWAFQNQFWFAYLLPLMAFCLLGLSEVYSRQRLLYYVGACVLGILSVGSMANGIFALPVLTLLSLLLKQKWPYSTFLGLLAILSVSLYLGTYQPPAHGHSISDNLIKFHFEILVFFIEYLGSPLKSLYGSFVLGLLHLSLIIVLFRQLPKEKNNPLYLSIIAFIIYYLVSAFVISASRVDLGLHAALVGRYTTPSILSLFLTLIAWFYLYPHRIKYLSRRTVTIIAVLMLGTQARTLIKNVDKIHAGQRYEAMQLTLGVYPKKWIQTIADHAYEKNLSIFSIKPYHGQKEKLGKKINPENCSKVKITLEHGNQYRTESVLLEDRVYYVVNDEQIMTGIGLMDYADKQRIRLVKVDPATGDAPSLYQCL